MTYLIINKHVCVMTLKPNIFCKFRMNLFCRNVTPQSRLDLKLWSCHTLRKELLGSATIDLMDTLRTHDGKSKVLPHTNN